MLGRKRKIALFFLLLAINSLLTPNFMVFPASATTDSGAVNLVEAEVVWERTYGGTGDDRAFYAVSVGDGFVVVGSSKSFHQDAPVAWVLRLDSEGNMLWNRTFLEGDGSEFRSVLRLDDGFLLVGNVFLSSGNIDGYVVRVDDEGKARWSITLGGEAEDKLFSAVETQDGFVLSGLTYSFGGGSDVWVVKIDGDGNEVWGENYGGAMYDVGRATALLEDSHYVVAGYTNSMGNGDHDFLVLKIDTSGNLVWNKTYGGMESDKAYAVTETTGGCVVAGDTRSKGDGETDAWIIKVDANGNLVWDKAVGGGGFDMPTCITAANEGFLAGGFTFSFGNGERDFWLFKIDDAGNVSWSCTVGKTEFEEAYAALEVGENEFVMAGWTNSIGQGHYDFYVVKLGVENEDSWLPAYNFMIYAFILSAVVIVVLIIVFLIVRRYVNQKISKQNGNSS
jgi:hypothetical protein